MTQHYETQYKDNLKRLLPRATTHSSSSSVKENMTGVSTNVRFGSASFTGEDGIKTQLPTVMRVKPFTGINQLKVVTLKKETKVRGGAVLPSGQMVALWTTDPFSVVGQSRTDIGKNQFWGDWDKSHIVNYDHPYFDH